MIAFTASFLCSALFGLRLRFPAFLPLMLLATGASFAVQGVSTGAIVLVALQAGYLSGAILRAFSPGAEPRPALREAAARS